MKRHIDGDRLVQASFDRIRDIAVAMREALARQDWPEVGRQIALEWENRKRLAPGVTTSEIDALLRLPPGLARSQERSAAPVAEAACSASAIPRASPASGARWPTPARESWTSRSKSGG